MLRLTIIFIYKILLNGKFIVAEKLFKYQIKYLVKSNLKFNYKFFQLLISYTCFIFKCSSKMFKNKQLNSKLFILINNKVLFSLKFLVNNIKIKNKTSLLLNLNHLLLKKKIVYNEILKYKKLLLFYRW